LIIVHALQHASEDQREKILETLGNKSVPLEQIRETTDLINSLGSISYAERRAREYAEKSKNALAVFPNTEDKEDLISLVDLITTRKY